MKTILCSLILISCSLFAFAQSTPVVNNGKLHVQSGQIVNQGGLPAQLTGISLSWSIWGGRKYYNPAVVNWLCQDFKISLLRVSMAVQPDSGYLQQPDKQRQLITAMVDKAIENGIYVLIDWHDHNAHLHTPQAKEFFGNMARKYKGVPNVIYEIWNEPERIGWDTVKNYAVELITEIRKYDEDNLIVVGSPHWDQDVDVAANNPITGFQNIAYSFHFYATEPSHQDGLRLRANYAIAKGLPLFVTEWGVGEANGDGEFNKGKNRKWLKWMQQHQLSWANWNITDKKETTAILRPGAPVNGGWTKEQLTPAGNYIRKVLRKLNM
ncbi:glycoside hydrolase family 5 protein [Mucilaginibacter terrae]|uniref:glycoside hydrolase family 5 protein n=1 Tax=Mucilaginibacter terrae TaxID=1955052 RepID=UPI00363C6F12